MLALLAAWKAGGTVVPVNPMYKSAELAHVLTDAEVTALVCEDHAWAAYVREAAAGTPVRVAFTAAARDFQTRDDERVLKKPASPRPRAPPTCSPPPAPPSRRPDPG
ncbi:AMP-binding protein [Streptomyces sp. M19]